MKKVFLYLIILVFTIGCVGKSDRTINWIGKAKKPIKVTLHAINLYGDHNYTLTDGNGIIYVTGFVDITLPKTINNPIKH